MVKAIIDFIKSIFKKTAPITPVNPPVNPPVTPIDSKFIWDNPVDARHSVRVICDNKGLTVNEKNVLCACVHAESNFNPQAIHQNKDLSGNVLSTDWGIAQINDYWHIGNGKEFPSVEYVLDNPQKCIEWMCDMWLAGKENLWCSYTSGLYKKYL